MYHFMAQLYPKKPKRTLTYFDTRFPALVGPGKGHGIKLGSFQMNHIGISSFGDLHITKSIQILQSGQ